MRIKLSFTVFAFVTFLGVSIAQAKTVAASDNAWVRSGQGDQSEAGSLTINGNSRIAYLRFDISTFNVASNDLVYLDLFFKLFCRFKCPTA